MAKKTEAEIELVRGNLYDFPQYYDMIFATDCRSEIRFLERCLARYFGREALRGFEPGCGTGRLLIKLAQRGYQVSGLDLNPHAIAYCNARLERNGFPASAFVGDMTDFRLKHKVEFAFNLINTVRHLPGDEALLKHLDCMTEVLVKQGLYFLGLHLTPATPAICTEECWEAARGRLRVASRLWTKEVDLQTRQERIGITYDVTTPSKRLRVEDETIFWTYTRAQMDRVLSLAKGLEVVGTYDFRYRLDRPIEVNDSTEDVIYVLQRR